MVHYNAAGFLLELAGVNITEGGWRRTSDTLGCLHRPYLIFFLFLLCSW